MTHFIFIFASLLAHASTQLPYACNSPTCSSEMRAIYEEFEGAGPITAERPAIFSGECYHLDRLYNPAHAHHGFTLLESQNDASFMGGMFAFFNPENPYAHLTLEKARELAPRRFDETHRLTLEPTFAFVDMNAADPSTPWKYWLRQKDQTLLMVGQWGISHRLFCRFEKNQNASTFDSNLDPTLPPR